MRQAYHDIEYITDKNGNIYGINLGYDYCAEHEWGINRLLNNFGVSNIGFGIDRRRQGIDPESILVHKFTKNKQKYIALVCFPNKRYIQQSEKMTKAEITKMVLSCIWVPCNGNISTAWDASSFAICTTLENESKIRQLEEAIRNKQLVIGLGPSMPFKNGGLKLMYADLIPAEIAQAVYDADEDYYNLETAAFEKTKIKDILKKAGKSWYALSPAWANEKKTKVKYFLNPCEQRKYNYGWFTLHDLKLWAKDKGPIVI